MLQISELYIYPIKSLGGISVKQATVTDRGFENDRRWMLVDENNCFITQRQVPEMALLQVAIEDASLRVTHKIKGDSINIPFISGSGEQEMVTIWNDICPAVHMSDKVDDWFTTMLGITCRLTHMPDETRRQVDQNYAPGDAITSFSDAYPYLIIGQATLDELNSRLEQALPVNRFRPNMVFTGGEPFEEDKLGHFVINHINFYGVKLCARCVIITIDQDSGLKGKEPTKTLSTYRMRNNNVYIGQNLVHKGEGFISVGDSLQVISLNHEERFIIKTPD